MIQLHYSNGGVNIVEGSILDAEQEALDKKGEWRYGTYYDNFQNHPHRTTGSYVLGSATAELNTTTGKDWHYHLRLKFTNLKDCQRLYTLIRAGKIAPVISYEEAQHDTTIRHLADLWREFVLLIRTTVSNRIHRLRQA